MRQLLTVVLVLSPVAVRADEKKPEKPVDLPVKAKLLSKKTTFILDLKGKTPAEYRASIKDGVTTGRLPATPAVEMTLELTNTSDKDIQIWTGGDPVTFTFELKGPGAESVAPRMAFTTIYRGPTPTLVAAGKKVSIPINNLNFGFRNMAKRAFWTAPGEYTLKVTYNTGISPAPSGVKAGADGFGRVAISAAPLALKVEAAK